MSLTEAAVQGIREMILSGELGPGDRLPPENALSERLGLSRGSLREAVKALEAMRVLNVRRGDGTYVTSLEPSLLTETMAFVVDLHSDRSLVDLLEVRRILECASARKAAAVADAELVAGLRAEIPAADVDYDTLVEADLRFHRIIAHASGNDYLVGLLDGLSASTVRARVWRGLTQEGAVPRTIDEHAAIVRALELGDPELSAAAMAVHIGGIEEFLRRDLEALVAQVDLSERVSGEPAPAAHA